MSKIAHGKTFRSGNSVAIRLPKNFDIGAEVEMELHKTGDMVVLRPRQRMSSRDLVTKLREIGPPADGVQDRPPFEYPDRRGL